MQTVNLKIRGLATSDNDLGSVPEGSLLVADNIVIDKTDIAEPRRGYDRLSAAFATGTDRAQRLFVYQDTLFSHVDSGTDYLAYWDGAAWQTVGSYAAPTSSKLYTCEANQNLYFVTSAGVKKLDAYNGTVAAAGAYKGLDVSTSFATTVPTWLPSTNLVNYRVVWGYKDANQNLVLGAPSQIVRVENTAGADRSVVLRITIPSGVTTAWFVQVYRSATATTGEPSDDLQLVYEANPVSGDLTNGYIDVADITPADFRSAALYTNAAQEGLAQGNEQPPLAKDIAVFKGHTFYAGTTSKHRYFLDLLSVNDSGTPANGLAVDDTLTIGGITYTAKASETIASAQFDHYDAGTAAQNVRETALSLVRVINRHTSSTVYAYYLSGPDDVPGKILLEERGIGGASFAVTSSRATCWSPALPSSGTTESSTNESFANGIFFSKPNQPEAVPLPQFFQVGSKDAAILRIIPLRDSLFVFKEDGIYRVTGENAASFTVSLLDSSAKVLAPESLAVLNNEIYALSDQGVIKVSETGVAVISRAIEQDILDLIAASLSSVKAYSWGVAYESERKYILFTISNSGDTYATQAFVYNTFTNSWVRWELSKRCGVVSPVDDKLYLGDALSAYVNKERKTRTFTDQVDYGFSTTITATTALTVTINSGADNIAAGDILYQSASVFSIVESVNTVTGVVTVVFEAAFAAGSVDVLKAISTEIQWVPITMGNPAGLKRNHTAIYLFKSDFSGTGTATFKSDLSPFEETVAFEGAGIGSWGLFGLGEIPWGGTNQRRPIRTWIPRRKQVCSQLTVGFRHSTGYASWELAGVSVVGEPGGEKVSR